MLPDRYKGGIVSFRNDRMGARILTLLNTIRIAHDYDLPYFFTWVSHGRASEELKSPTEIFDKAYFDAHFVSHEDFKLVNAAAQDIQTLSLTATAETISQHAAAGKAFVCAAPDLSCLPWEDETQVAEKYARAIAELKFNSKVIEAMDALKETLSGSGTAFHIRRGDIIYDPITSNNLWSNKYIPREYYEVLAQRLVKDPNARILVFSDEPKEIARLKAMSDQIITPSEVIQDDLTLAQRDFIEIFAMSLCNEIIGPPGSGFSASAALIGNKPIRDIRDVLSPEENGKAMDLLVARLEEHSDIFLSEGDIGQCFPFMIEHLNAVGAPDRAMDILDDYAARGFQKIYFFKLRALQQITCQRASEVDNVFVALRRAKLDRTIPGRSDLQWSELCRIAAVSHAISGRAVQARDSIAMALWYAGGNRLCFVTLSQLIDGGFVEVGDFPIPFDPLLFRPLPAMRPDTPRPHLVEPPNQPEQRRVMPPDLMIRDWQQWLGKTLNRGFDTEGAIRRALELLQAQFGRSAPPASVASAVGVYHSLLDDHFAAEACLEKALNEQPDNALFLKRLGAAKLRADERSAEGRQLLKQAAETSGRRAIFEAELAQCEWAQGDKEDASVRMYRAATAEGFVLPELKIHAARLQRQSKNVSEETLTLVDGALEAAPHVRRFMAFRVHVLCDLGKKDLAQEGIADIETRFGEAGDLTALRKRAGL